MLATMCGRFADHHPLRDFAAAAAVEVPPELFAELEQQDTGPRYNIPPGTNSWIVAMDAGGQVGFGLHKWNFPTTRGNRINVRSETAHVVPEYREHYNTGRCVVLASGFYEPKGDKAAKDRPWFYFRPRDEAPLFLGAIAKAEGFSILTRKPVEPVASIHDRTPVFIPADNVLAWLDPEIAGRDALAQFAPPEYGERLDCWRVSDAAKRPGNEGPELIQRMEGQAGQFG